MWIRHSTPLRGTFLRESLIPYGRQELSKEDIDAVVDVLRSDWLTQGPAVERFERLVANYCGAEYAVAVNSATSALHIACLAAGLQPGDGLWTSPNTFVASANCALYCGALPYFVDIDPRSYNLDEHCLEEKLACAKRDGRLPQVVIPVHFAGQPCEMEHIASLSERYGFTVIEDASHALGGRYRNTRIGSCTYSAMTVFSFHPVKIITTGEGGMILTNRRDHYEKLMRLRSHGITRDPSLMSGPSHGPWYYEQIELGFNYRMSDIQAALGASQIERLDEFIERRQRLARRYDEGLKELPVVLPWRHPDNYSALHLYVLRLHCTVSGKSKLKVFEELRKAGINVNLHYIPVHMQPYYRQLGFNPGDYPRAEEYYEEALTLPLFPGLTDSAQDRVISALRDILR